MASTSLGAVSISSKPWHLTHVNLDDLSEIFIWKNGCRMKLKDGTSSGPVTAVTFRNNVDKVVTVSYYLM